MRLTSPAFSDGDKIPPKFTCDGDDVNPELRIADVPGDTASLVVLVDDPTATMGSWLHWSVWNIAADVRVIPEHWRVRTQAVEGETDFSEIGYGGPCPSYGEHEYRFMVFALDVRLDVASGSRREVVEAAMAGHILSSATLTGKYQRVKKEPRKAKKVDLVSA